MADDQTISSNRKAFHEFAIGERYEAGIVLCGTEVKSARGGKVNLGGSWVDIDGAGEAWLRDAQISKYSHGTHSNHEERRPRKLLLKKTELARLARQVEEKGFTIVPVRMYVKGQHIKVEIAVAKGKQDYDKREATRKREADRAMDRAVRRRR